MNNDARQWISNFVNNPFLKQQQALVIEGPQGSGKTVFCELLMKITRFGHKSLKSATLSGGEISSQNILNFCHDKNLFVIDEPKIDVMASIVPFIKQETHYRERKMQERDIVTIQTNFIITMNDATHFGYQPHFGEQRNRRFIIVNPVTAFALLSSI